MQRILVENGLGTMDECKDDIPIVVQSFEWNALDHYREMTDFPQILLVGVDDSPLYDVIRDYIASYFYLVPFSTWTLIPDWEEVSRKVSGVAPDHQWVTKPGSLTDKTNMTEDWDKLLAKNEYSDFVKYMHELDLVVHPWPL